MRRTYIDFVRNSLEKIQAGEPIYTKQLAESFHLDEKAAAAATAVAFKRIMDTHIAAGLRFYQKGIYYKTPETPLGEVGINKEQLIADKYILPHIGYETGHTALYRLGLTAQMPRERLIATNIAKNCALTDKRLGVTIRPPKVTVTAENKAYLQVLDVLDLLDKVPGDGEQPYAIISDHIQNKHLQYNELLAIADSYYNQNTVLQLARTASAGGISV